MDLVSAMCAGGTLSPDLINQLIKTTVLDLSGRHLSSLPPSLFLPRPSSQPSSLTIPSSSSSSSSSYASTSITNNLQQLLCAGNQITKLPRDILQLEGLTTLYLSKNSLGLLPALQALRSLTSLHASENHLSDFPICLPSSLVSLDLSRNAITTIPPDIEHLNKLQFLSMWSNQLTVLPPEMAYLTSLERLWIDANKIESLPQGLKLLTNLKEIHAFDNPLSPPELLQIAEKGVMSDIIGHLEKVYLKECRRIYRTKIIVVGPLNAGKTYLIDHLIRKKKSNSNKPQEAVQLKKSQPNPNATNGAASRQFSNLYKSKRIVFNVWEFSGDPSYHPAPLFFYHEENVIYLLVYNAVASQDCKFETYLEEIRSKAPVAPIIVVGTHADMPNFSEKYKEYARPKLEKKCANFNATAFTEINLHNASSINEFKTLLSKVALESIPTMGELAPPQFAIVLDSLKYYKPKPPNETFMSSVSYSWVEYRQALDFYFTHNLRKSDVPLLAESRPSAEELKKIARIMNSCGDTIYYGDLNVWDENARLVAVLGTRVVHNVQDLLIGVCKVVQNNQQTNNNNNNNPLSKSSTTRTRAGKSSKPVAPPPPPDLSSFLPSIREWLESDRSASQ